MSNRQCNCDFNMVAFYRNVSDHVEIDDADADLRVKNSAQVIDDRVPVDQSFYYPRLFSSV